MFVFLYKYLCAEHSDPGRKNGNKPEEVFSLSSNLLSVAYDELLTYLWMELKSVILVLFPCMWAELMTFM